MNTSFSCQGNFPVSWGLVKITNCLHGLEALGMWKPLSRQKVNNVIFLWLHLHCVRNSTVMVLHHNYIFTTFKNMQTVTSIVKQCLSFLFATPALNWNYESTDFNLLFICLIEYKIKSFLILFRCEWLQSESLPK